MTKQKPDEDERFVAFGPEQARKALAATEGPLPIPEGLSPLSRLVFRFNVAFKRSNEELRKLWWRTP